LPDIHTPLPGAFIPKAAATVNAASLRKFHLVADMQQLFGMIPARSANRQSSMLGLTFFGARVLPSPCAGHPEKRMSLEIGASGPTKTRRLIVTAA
jgi:hypothetical protein